MTRHIHLSMSFGSSQGFMPLVFYSAVSVLGCDGNKCEVTAQVVGYDTALQHPGWSIKPQEPSTAQEAESSSPGPCKTMLRKFSHGSFSLQSRTSIPQASQGSVDFARYVVANALSWILGFGLVIPTTHPILLRMVAGQHPGPDGSCIPTGALRSWSCPTGMPKYHYPGKAPQGQRQFETRSASGLKKTRIGARSRSFSPCPRTCQPRSA